LPLLMISYRFLRLRAIALALRVMRTEEFT
jgi:hypothetical protein